MSDLRPDDPPATTGATPTPAATVVPLRDGSDGLEVLLLRRNRRGSFGGMWVFPGGQVDAADHAAGGHQGEVAAARHAAVREAREEAALDLDHAELEVLSFWMPPPEAPRRFATWFFVAAAGDAPEVVVDAGEIHEHRWMSPGGAIAARNAGEIELVPPTFVTLWWLAQHRTVAEVMRAAASAPAEEFRTRIVPVEGTGYTATVWEGDPAYTGAGLDAPGPRRRLLMHPDGWQVEMSEVR
jgi:8-oxo-dGTP pyrophosphatase MutT (NUDIX family)